MTAIIDLFGWKDICLKLIFAVNFVDIVRFGQDAQKIAESFENCRAVKKRYPHKMIAKMS